jgi:OmpA-OmpF porin, OOP family
MRSSFAYLGFALILTEAAGAQEIDLEVVLMGPLSAQSSRKGERVSARVVGPETLKDNLVEGKVNEARASGKIRGRSVLNFSFENLQHAGQPIPITSQVKSVVNSKGQVDVDEEGRVLRNTNNLGKAAVGTAIGGLIGGIAGGAKGAAIGAGAGAVASVVLIEVAADGPDIRLDTGSRVTLSAKSRSGPSLADLAPAAPAPIAAAPATAVAPSGTNNTPGPPSTAAAAAPATTAAPSAGATANQPDLTTVKADFIPGSKVLFYDDFTDMAGDEPPPRWKVRGGSVALKVGGGIHQLTPTTDRVELTPMFKNLPKNFTLETEIKLDNPGDTRSVWYIHDETWSGPLGPNAALTVFLQAWEAERGFHVSVAHHKDGTLAQFDGKADYNQPLKQAIWIQNGRVRVYVNGERLIDVNQVELPPLTGAVLHAESGENKVGYRVVRLGESTPDFSQVISSAGRYVTHGIVFDVDSDRLKPESAAVIRSVARGLETNANLKLRIEGHTDSTGNAEHNLDLSKRRAEAVKAVLVSQFGIAAERLTTDGLGPSKPLDSNDTPGGRAHNRRVEFVRM